MRLNREMVTDRALEINHQSLAGSAGFYGAASPARTEAFRQQPRPATLWPMRPMAFCLPALLLVAGCSTFQRDWEQLANKPAPLGIEGRWEGSWKSDVSGHADRLRCIISRRDAQAYLARFHAKYRKLFSFGYRLPLKVQQHRERYDFSGEANLHWYAGGRYSYRGSATPTNFVSTYQCKSDHGTFEMHRPADH